MAKQNAAPIALSMGSNIGDRLAFLRAAVEGVKEFIIVQAVSPVYETLPLYVEDQPLFFNIAVLGTAAIDAFALLRAFKGLEADIGRTPTFRNGPRAIDIDILLYGDQSVDMPELKIPHPHMGERDFVLYPLADIAPDWVHPQTGKTISAMRDAVSDRGLRKTQEIL